MLGGRGCRVRWYSDREEPLDPVAVVHADWHVSGRVSRCGGISGGTWSSTHAKACALLLLEGVSRGVASLRLTGTGTGTGSPMDGDGVMKATSGVCRGDGAAPSGLWGAVGGEWDGSSGGCGRSVDGTGTTPNSDGARPPPALCPGVRQWCLVFRGAKGAEENHWSQLIGAEGARETFSSAKSPEENLGQSFRGMGGWVREGGGGGAVVLSC